MKRAWFVLVCVGPILILGSVSSVRAADSSWSRVGAVGGNVRSIAIDPSDQRRVYAAARNEGIYRSGDRGSTWELSDAGLDFISAWGVDVDPSNPNVVWAATEMGGAYRSTDQGKTWRHTHDGMSDALGDYALDDPTQNSSAVDPPLWSNNAPDKVNRGGMWGYVIDQCISEKSGTANKCSERFDWPIGGFDYRDPDIDPDPAVTTTASQPYPKFLLHYQFGSSIAAFPGGAFMGAFRGSNNRLAGGLFRSSDAGATWGMQLRDSSGGRLFEEGPSSENAHIWKVGIARSDASKVYAASGAGVWASDDGGSTWRGNAPVRPAEIRMAAFSVSESRALAVDPKNADIVYAGVWGKGLYRSTNAGRDWTEINSGLPKGAGVWDIAINPLNSKDLFAAVWNSGVYESADSGVTWSQLNSGFDVDTSKQVYALAIDKGGSPQNLYAGTINGIWRISSENFGKRLADTGPRLDTTSTLVGLALMLFGLLLRRSIRSA